jgi:hypothetical protein
MRNYVERHENHFEQLFKIKATEFTCQFIIDYIQDTLINNIDLIKGNKLIFNQLSIIHEEESKQGCDSYLMYIVNNDNESIEAKVNHLLAQKSLRVKNVNMYFIDNSSTLSYLYLKDGKLQEPEKINPEDNAVQAVIQRLKKQYYPDAAHPFFELSAENIQYITSNTSHTPKQKISLSVHLTPFLNEQKKKLPQTIFAKYLKNDMIDKIQKKFTSKMGELTGILKYLTLDKLNEFEQDLVKIIEANKIKLFRAQDKQVQLAYSYQKEIENETKKYTCCLTNMIPANPVRMQKDSKICEEEAVKEERINYILDVDLKNEIAAFVAVYQLQDSVFMPKKSRSTVIDYITKNKLEELKSYINSNLEDGRRLLKKPLDYKENKRLSRNCRETG